MDSTVHQGVTIGAQVQQARPQQLPEQNLLLLCIKARSLAACECDFCDCRLQAGGSRELYF